MKLSDCPKALRKQRLATLRLARAFRAVDRTNAAAAKAAANFDSAFGAWMAGQGSITREQARAMLEMAGLVERKQRGDVS